MNVLITSASRKVPLVYAFRSALAGRGRVIAVDADPLAAALYAADDARVLPPAGGDALADALLALCVQERIALLVPTRDAELLPLARHRDRFRDHGTTVMVADADIVDTCQDKLRFVEFCAARGFDVPPLLDADAIEEDAFPVFVRPRRGRAGVGAGSVTNAAQLRTRRAAGDELIVQCVVEAPEYTIDLFSDFGGRVLSAVPRERIQVVAGESVVGRTHRDRTLIDQAVRLASALGLVGHNTLQCFFDGTSVQWIEINPRYGGAANLGFAAGAHTPSMLVALVAGEEVRPRIGEFTDGLYMFRHATDLFVHAAAVSHVPTVAPAARAALP